VGEGGGDWGMAVCILLLYIIGIDDDLDDYIDD